MEFKEITKKLVRNGSNVTLHFPSWMNQQLGLEVDLEVSIVGFDRGGRQVVELSWPLPPEAGDSHSRVTAANEG